MSDPVTDARAQCRVQNFLSWRWGEVKGKKDPSRSRVYIFWSRVADMTFPADYQTSLSWHWRSVSHVSSSFRQPCPQTVTLDIVSFISMSSSSILFFTVLFPPSLYRFSCFLLKRTSRVTKGQRQAVATNGASRDYIYFYAQTRAHTHCSLSLTDAYITSCHGYSTTHRHRSSEPSTETILGIIAMVITQQLKCWHLAIISTPGHQVTDSTSPWRGNSCSSICYSSVTKLTFSCYISLDSNNRRCWTNN